MSPGYIYNEMTWAEISAALDYVYRYELKEPHYKGSIKLNDWLYKRVDTLAKDLTRVVSSIKKEVE